ncbi:response regulator transcription factor [Pseudoalteromonas sp. MMG010]|uniref:LytR/AlgR family response regulator transcription factor n=1 Tax=Pseudoalteromonas sp. MMG010 TaxID=2822685 RepID=UPI001B3A2319|nr:response regulator transcription factor [Pseudoalteromonas sp. MMG010]MBQ4833064.1 response regulator transcription factor [Pseudoalteromonas sp. MMG010]
MNVLIVDDEPLARARLKRLLESNAAIQCINQAENGSEALKIIKATQPELVLLDVNMPQLSGLDVAKALDELSLPPAIIFTTAHPEHALDALQLNVAGYLVKPISKQSLALALAKLGQLNRAQVHNQQQKLTYKLAGSVRSIAIETVIYVSAEDKYTHVVFQGGSALIEKSLKQLELQYPNILLRVHRNTLVNKNNIIAMHAKASGHVVELAHCDHLIAVSRRALKMVKAEI